MGEITLSEYDRQLLHALIDALRPKEEISEVRYIPIFPDVHHLAAMAMQSLVERVGRVVGAEKEIASAAYLMADAMLAERKRRQEAPRG